MKTVEEYTAERLELVKKIGDKRAQWCTENRDPNPDELETMKEIRAKIEELDSIITSETANAEIEQRYAKKEEPLTKVNPTESRSPSPEARAYPQPRKSERFATLGEQLAAVVKAGQQGGYVDPRLNSRAATGMGENVPSDGGFLVQTDFSNELLQDVFKTGVLAQRCRRIQISSAANSIKMNGVDETSRASTRYGGVLGYWKDEAALKTASKPKFRQIELSLKKLIGLCYATDELLMDASALEGFIRQAFIAEFGFLLDDAIINGTGAGQPLGILNAGCLVSVDKEAGQTAATVSAENVVKMRSRLFAQSWQNAVWLINQNVMPQLHTMSIGVGTGGSLVYMPANGLSGSPFDTLYGRPVIPIEQCATLGTVGDILLADLNGYILAEKGNIQADMSIHVQFLYDESVFRFVMRVDGQPLRASALTPYKGGASYTQSHFIALATRA